MKRTFLVFLLLLTCQIKLFSQDKADSPRPTSALSGKFQIGLSFSPNVSYRWLRQEGGNVYTKSEMENRNQNETPVFGFTTGVNGIYSFSPKSGIQFGIHVSKCGYRSRWHEGLWYSDDGEVVKIQIKDRMEYYFLELPMSYQFCPGSGDLRFLMRGGIITHFLLTGKQDVTTIFGRSTTESSFPIGGGSPFFSAFISTGVDWKLGPHLNFRAEPIIRYGLTSRDDFEIRSHLWSAGLDCSVFYRF